MRIVFAGTPSTALPALEAVAASRHQVCAVLTRPDAPAGRGRQLVSSPVGAWAHAHGVEVLTPVRPREPEFLDRLVALAPDCVPVVAYGSLVPASALAIPRHGWINLHFSLLPAWRGAAPVQHAIRSGDEVGGATVFQLEQGLDTGPVFASLTEAIRPRDTSGELLDRLAHAGAGLLVRVLDGIEDGHLAPVPQSADGVSLAPKITVDDARIRWQDPAFAVDRLVRACTPAPGAWSLFRSERIKVGPVRPVADASPVDLEPGDVAVAKNRVIVGTATVPVELGLVRAAGKREMPAVDWARGVRVSTGERFG